MSIRGAAERQFWLIPAKAGIHSSGVLSVDEWVPTCAGTYRRPDR